MSNPDDDPADSAAPTGESEPGDGASSAAESVPGRPCPGCGTSMRRRHCKYVCPKHGVVYDCSDTFY